MAVSVRIKPLDKSFLFSPGGALNPATAAGLVADFARQEIAKADEIDSQIYGRPVPRETFVNDIQSGDFNKIQPGKSIVAVYALGVEAVEYVWDQVIAHSPILSGRFVQSQRIFADGVEVEDPHDCAQASEVVIASNVPYARKIEGVSGKKPQSEQAPEGVYEVVAALAASRFGNIARIRFGFRSLTGGASDLDKWSKGASATALARRVRGGREDRHADWLTRQPAVIIGMR